VTPEMRAGISRKAWSRGELPAFPYRPRGRRFHGWTFSYRDGNLVGIDLMLQPGPKERQGPITFAVNLKRLHGRWLVDSILPEAMFAPAGKRAKVFARNDTLAPEGGQVVTDKPRLGTEWFAVPVGVLALAVTVPVAVVLLSWRRDRRAARDYRRSPRRSRKAEAG
jgi:hypothetical protein